MIVLYVDWFIFLYDFIGRNGVLICKFLSTWECIYYDIPVAYCKHRFTYCTPLMGNNYSNTNRWPVISSHWFSILSHHYTAHSSYKLHFLYRQRGTWVQMEWQGYLLKVTIGCNNSLTSWNSLMVEERNMCEERQWIHWEYVTVDGGWTDKGFCRANSARNIPTSAVIFLPWSSERDSYSAKLLLGSRYIVYSSRNANTYHYPFTN